MPKLTIDMATTQDEFTSLGYQTKYRDAFFAGDLMPFGPKIDMRIEKGQVGDYGIYSLKSRAGLVFRRSWHHIRDDKTDLLLFWFPRHGQTVLSLSSGRYVVNAGECAIARSSVPFLVQQLPGTNGSHEAMHVHVPSSMFCPALLANVELGKPFPTLKGGLSITERILELLFREDTSIDPETAESLIRALLQGVLRKLDKKTKEGPSRVSLSDRRLLEILRCINQHFANPDVNVNFVANRCKISVRYLCHIMKEHHNSFSDILWHKRLTTALKWLCHPDMCHHQMREIAYQAGFKSTPHFSRSFKKHYGITPSRFREHPELLDVEKLSAEPSPSLSIPRRSARRSHQEGLVAA